MSTSKIGKKKIKHQRAVQGDSPGGAACYGKLDNPLKLTWTQSTHELYMIWAPSAYVLSWYVVDQKCIVFSIASELNL